jgi:hypothetical protein
MGETSGSKNGKPKRGTRKGKGNIKAETKAEMVALLPELGTQTAVAEAFGVSHDVVSKAAADPEIAKLANVKKEQLADKFGQLVDKLLTRHLEIANTATLDDKSSTLLGIAADKHRLYSDEPTTITENRDSAALRDEALNLLEQYKVALGGDEVKAREMLAADAPTLSRWVN